MWLALRSIFGTIWALGPLVAGLVLWQHQQDLGRWIDAEIGAQFIRTIAFWCIASAQFVFMVVVADALAPRVPVLARFTLKWFVGTGFYLSLIWAGVLGYRLFG